MVPLTGIAVHKLASALFLILCLIHTVMHRKKLQTKRYLLIGMILIAFISGIFGMIFDGIPIVLILHKTLSIAILPFLAVHIFIFRKKN